jgi:phosphopantothenoylcysteine decarboxylase/phosphopantothenate--cysteine ligase
MANGMPGDTITAACLATSVPVVVAPAMDGGMYAHPATQANVARLREFGYRIVDPEPGVLASGMIGQGRLADLARIVDATVEALNGVSGAAPAVARPSDVATPAPARSDLAGRHVVVTAGGTAEPIDPVRFVGNRSTGRMGIAVAAEALDRGAAVTLILANVSVDPPAGAHVARAETAAQMQAALQALTPPEGPHFDILVMAAAVADFRPKAPSGKKVSRSSGLTLEMDPTPDLLAETADRVRAGIRASKASRPILVGFAAETGSFDRVSDKLRGKGVDLLVANDVESPGSGFGTDTNKVTIYSTDAPPEELPLLSKREVAELLLDRVVVRLASAESGAVSGSVGGAAAGGTAAATAIQVTEVMP